MSVENRHKSPVLLRPYLVIPAFLISSTVLFVVNKCGLRAWGKRGQVGRRLCSSTYPHASTYPQSGSAQSKCCKFHRLFSLAVESLTSKELCTAREHPRQNAFNFFSDGIVRVWQDTLLVFSELLPPFDILLPIRKAF